MRFHPVLVTGLALLLYSGFAAFHHSRAHAEDDEVPVPFEIVLSTLGGLLLSLVGALSSIPEFKASKGLWSLNAVKRDEFLDRPSMRIYRHRARDFKLRLTKASS
jgi:hypothetical protein